MSLLRNASVASACLLAMASIATAEQVRLSIGQLDYVTAGAMPLIPPIPPISPISPIGGGGGVPSPGDPSEPAPTPPAPAPVKPHLTVSSGDGLATAYLPTVPAGSTTEIDVRITPRANGTSGLAYVRVSSEGGGPINLPGISASAVHTGD
ncbi:MAG: hypothetical protein H6852_01235 [Geminicoccaceae bacterium]|nr:hypothetical protein [Geminicoccaceae bacterium]HRW60948.1 hypothetical protein [Defluviicoccus sp.]